MKNVNFVKKLILVSVALLAVLCTAAAAADLEFKPREGGKYIYCNNREFILREDLADTSNMRPKYIMNNENMEPDRYTLFASHVNHTEVKDNSGVICGKGYDIELDVAFIAKEDTTVKITALGFEVPENVKYYINREEYTTEKDWGCFTAWASYLGTEISKLDSGEKYKPVPFETTEFKVKAGDTAYLSEFIPNYRTVPIWRPVHLMTDFEIIEGLCDVNVLAVKSTGTVGNRKYVSPDIGFGAFIPEYEIKGIANSQNQVDAYLDLKIPADISSGSKLPIKVYNRYAPQGNTVYTWFTNLNPTSDIWSKSNVAESCMLAFDYKDSSKLAYYGSDVNAAEKDDVWHFDTNHVLISEYKPDVGFTKKKFVPNFEITDYVPEAYCNALGNYGVFQNYHVTVTNEGLIDRYFNYCLNTAANNLIILRDAAGNIVDGYPLTKGTVGTKETDKLVNIKVPAKETVNFTLTVILTTNYVGGMENAFTVSDTASPVYTYDADYLKNVRDAKYTGKEYWRFDDGTLYLSSDNKAWLEKPVSLEVKNIFETSGELEITQTGNGYILNNCQHSGVPYNNVGKFYREIWALNDNFELKWKTDFSHYPTASSGAFGIYYIKAGTNYYSKDGKLWNLLGGNLNLPCYNYGRFAASSGNGEICLSEDGISFYDVAYEGEKPLYIDAIGDVYYYASDKSIYVSADGVYWTELECPCEITKLGRTDTCFLINDSVEVPIPKLKRDNLVLKLKDRYLGYCKPPEKIHGTYYVSLRSTVELCNGSVTWDDKTATATATIDNCSVKFKDGEEIVSKNGETAKVTVLDGKMLVPEFALELFEVVND